VEDYRSSSEVLTPPQPPAMRSMEAFKTRRSFLTGERGFDVSPYSSTAGTERSSSGAQQDSLTCSLGMRHVRAKQAQQDRRAAVAARLTMLDGCTSDTDEEDDIF
jgi:hypothetical protein